MPKLLKWCFASCFSQICMWMCIRIVMKVWYGCFWFVGQERNLKHSSIHWALFVVWRPWAWKHDEHGFELCWNKSFLSVGKSVGITLNVCGFLFKISSVKDQIFRHFDLRRCLKDVPVMVWTTWESCWAYSRLVSFILKRGIWFLHFWFLFLLF